MQVINGLVTIAPPMSFRDYDLLCYAMNHIFGLHPLFSAFIALLCFPKRFIGYNILTKQVLYRTFRFCELAPLQAGALDLPDMCASRMHYYSGLLCVMTRCRLHMKR